MKFGYRIKWFLAALASPLLSTYYIIIMKILWDLTVVKITDIAGDPEPLFSLAFFCCLIPSFIYCMGGAIGWVDRPKDQELSLEEKCDHV